MAFDRSKQSKQLTFHCPPCSSSFKSEPGRIEGAAEAEGYPYEYFADCPRCGQECELVYWQKSLIKAWAKATGPKTEVGKAAAAANLEGHPTPEESLRTRFNAMKHGMNAKVATYFPAKPDGYSFCGGCDVDRVWCSQQPACAKQTELFMLHQAAFEQRNPKHLMGIYSEMQAAVFAVLRTILQTIVADGVKIESPEYYIDRETGRVVVAEWTDEQGVRHVIREINAHPLFRPLGELLTRANLSLADMGMTQKAIETEELEMGRISEDTAREDIDDYRRRQMGLLEDLAAKVQRANQRTESDPLLVEYQQENGGA